MSIRAIGLWLGLLAACAGVACDRLLPPRRAGDGTGPSRALAERAVRVLLPGLRFGVDEREETYREIREVRVAGTHYVPASNRHVVHYCVQFTSFAGDQARERCDLNVQLYQLDSNDWVGFATGAGTIYRWQVLQTSAPAAAADGSAPAEDAPAAQAPAAAPARAEP